MLMHPGPLQPRESQPEQVRLAITSFEDPALLWRTIIELLGDGLLSEQLCLIAPAKTMRGPCVSSLKDLASKDLAKINRECLVKLCEQTEEWSAQAGSMVVATSGPLLDSMIRAREAGDVAATKRPAFAPYFARTSADVDRQVGAGAIVLVVRSFTPKEQSLATRKLLSCSLGRVTTHEYAMPASTT